MRWRGYPRAQGVRRASCSASCAMEIPIARSTSDLSAPRRSATGPFGGTGVKGNKGGGAGRHRRGLGYLGRRWTFSVPSRSTVGKGPPALGLGTMVSLGRVRDQLFAIGSIRHHVDEAPAFDDRSYGGSHVASGYGGHDQQVTL